MTGKYGRTELYTSREQATLIDFRNGTIKVQNNAGQWSAPSDNGWAATGAP